MSSDGLTQAEQNLENAASLAQVPFFKFVLTGGPCGGKTTALARIYSFLRERGFQVITCPEAFSILQSNGMSLDFFATGGMYKVIQNITMDLQMTLEESSETVLKAHGKPSVLLCDRGPMDGAAYMSEDDWNELMEKRGIETTDLRDTRYNAVFHMVSAADGAAPFYTLENNAARSETAEEALAMDKRTQQAWLGHPHMYVFDNSTDFEGKLQRLVDRISILVGLPSNLSKRSAKFLLKSRPAPTMFPRDVAYHVFEVEKVYLVNQAATENEYSFVRKRTTIDKKLNKRGSVYQLTTVQVTSEGEIVEQKRIITAREYSAAYWTRDTTRHIIRQKRISFLYELQSFTIHVYETPSPGLCILHAQVESTEKEIPDVKLPPFLEVDRQLQGEEDEKMYGAYGLSLMN